MQNRYSIRATLAASAVAIIATGAALALPITAAAAESDESRAKSELLAAIRSVIRALTDVQEKGGSLSEVGDDIKLAITRVTSGLASFNAKDFKSTRSRASEADKIAQKVRDRLSGDDEEDDEDEEEDEDEREDRDEDEDEDEADAQTKAAEAIEDAKGEVKEVRHEMTFEKDALLLAQGSAYLLIADKWIADADKFYAEGNWSEAYRYGRGAEDQALKAGALF